MAKKKSAFGKLLTFTTTIITIGGACYIFRDKIKQCSIYQTLKDKLSALTGKEDAAEDDFFFDDEDEDRSGFDDVFEDTKHGREYTSITINAKDSVSPENKANENAADSETQSSEEDYKPSDSEDATGSTSSAKQDASSILASDAKEKDSKSPSAYENEGLSDISDDPDTLAEQDKLDF